MKKIALSFLLLASLSFTAKAQWYQLQPYPGFGSNIGGPVSPNVAGNGVILYGAISRGSNYLSELLMRSTNDLNSYTYAYSDVGYATGNDNIFTIASKNDSTYCFIYSINTPGPTGAIIVYTTNNFSTTPARIELYGGETLWAPTIPTCFAPNYIYSAAANVQYPADTTFIFRTSIATGSVTRYSTTKYVTPSLVCFTNNITGYMLSNYSTGKPLSVLSKTIDSGKTWNDCYSDLQGTITGFCFPAANIGYLTENNGTILKTINGGANWTKLTSPTTTPLNCVCFGTTLFGYVAGNSGVLYKTTNGGTTWTAETSNDTASISSLYTFDSVAYFIDTHYNIYKNESPMGIENLKAGANEVKVFPNPSSNGVFNYELRIKNYESGTISVYNILGEKVNTQTLRQAQGDNQANLSDQPNGIYFYKLYTDKGAFVASGKLVIQK